MLTSHHTHLLLREILMGPKPTHENKQLEEFISLSLIPEHFSYLQMKQVAERCQIHNPLTHHIYLFHCYAIK